MNEDWETYTYLAKKWRIENKFIKILEELLALSKITNKTTNKNLKHDLINALSEINYKYIPGIFEIIKKQGQGCCRTTTY